MRFARFLLPALLVFGACDCSDPAPSRDGGRGVDGGDPRDAQPDSARADLGHDDAGPRDAGADAACVSTACGTTERCFDGIDNDCDGTLDEDCGCAIGSTTRCIPAGTDPSLALCSWGEMSCVGSDEFGMWGPCMGTGTGTGGGDGGTSPYGCRRIGIMGAPGANPSSNFQTWLETQGAIATRFHADAGATTLQRAELETFDLVIVDWLQRVYSAEESTTLAEWVRDGGALMVMTGHDSGSTADRHVSLLTALGPSFDLSAGPINGPAVLVAHPTTATADGTGTLPPISFFGGLRTTVPAALAADIVPIAVIGSVTVGVAGPLGMGHVLLFGDEWIEFDSEWSAMPSIVQFWLNTVRWLSPDVALPVCE